MSEPRSADELEQRQRVDGSFEEEPTAVDDDARDARSPDELEQRQVLEDDDSDDYRDVDPDTRS
jgi:hypothetical protein